MKTGVYDTQTAFQDADLPIELFMRLDIEKYLDQVDRVAALETSQRRHLCTLLDSAEITVHKQSDSFFKNPRRDCLQMGTELLNNAKLTLQERDAVLEFQKSQTETVAVNDEFALGNILIANGHITRAQLEWALQQQLNTGRWLGEELIKAGHASRGDVERGLFLQRKLAVYALTASLALAPIVSTPAKAAQMSVAMPVSVTVMAYANTKTTFQTSHLYISTNDVALGYVDAPAASRFSITSNSRSGYLLEFQPASDLFDSVQVIGLGGDVHLGSDGGIIVQRGQSPGSSSYELSFRFVLRAEVMPGNYPWPLQLSVHPL